MDKTAQCAVCANAARIPRSGKVAAAKVAHIADTYLVGHLLPQKGRVLVGVEDIVVDKRDVHAA